MHTYSYGVLLYSDGRMPPLVALFADLYQFCTRYVKSNNDLCSADVLTIARNTRQVNTSAEHRSLLLVSCPPFSTYGLGVRYICSLAPVGCPGRITRRQTTWRGPYRPTPFVRRPHVARNTNRIFDIYLIRNLWTLLESWLVSVKLGRVY